MNNIEPEKKKIIDDVLAERQRQDEKWGEQNHNAYVWASIIGEEYGEMCKAINEFGFNQTPENEQDIYTETIQTIASCVAMLECMERARAAAKKKEIHTCEHCKTPGKYIAVEDFGDTRLFLGVSGEYLQIFDEEYPGRITNIKINNCPMCGRPLRDEEIIIKTNRVLRGLLLPPLPPGEYPAGCNKHGAVYVKLPEGKTLGVKPGEFEFIKAPAWLLELWKEVDNERDE